MYQILTFTNKCENANIHTNKYLGMLCTALVLSIQFPEIGNYWYLLTLISPFAGYYTYSGANREEEVYSDYCALLLYF